MAPLRVCQSVYVVVLMVVSLATKSLQAMQQKREKLNLASTQSLTLSNYLILIKTLYYANPPACCAVTYKILNDRDYVARSMHSQSI